MFPARPVTVPFYVACPFSHHPKKCYIQRITGYSISTSNGCDDFNGSSHCEKCIEIVSSFLTSHPDALTENNESNPFHFE